MLGFFFCFVFVFLNFYSLGLQGCLSKETTRLQNTYSFFSEHSSSLGSALRFTESFLLPEGSFGLQNHQGEGCAGILIFHLQREVWSCYGNSLNAVMPYSKRRGQTHIQVFSHQSQYSRTPCLCFSAFDHLTAC